MRRRRIIGWLVIIGLFFASTLSGCAKAPPPIAPEPIPVVPSGLPVSYESDVKPVLERRCVVCHGCYDAPCQVLLSSYEGVTRGASKQAVYQSSRLEAADPTRLFFDASTNDEWRKRGFFPVVGEPTSSSAGELGSLLQRMIVHGKAHPLAAGEKLPASVSLDIGRTLECATQDEFASYAEENPWGGMPYATAPLSDDEFSILARWLSQGSPGPPPAPPLPADLETQVRAVEAFVNGPSNKERLMARYLYEHLFLAHLYFEGEVGHYFEMVRSRTAPGSAIDVIATVRPYDDPGTDPFYYRLRPIRGTILHKTHILYMIGPKRLARWHELFLAPEWEVETLPSYEREVAANPFLSFAEVPARARYQFLLDDAEYTIMTFIRGPVCRGQVAVDVIEDRFWVSFLDPDWDLSVTDPTFLPAAAPNLVLPAEDAGDFKPGDLWAKGWLYRKRYVEFREERYSANDPKGRGLPLEAIWDGGEARNSNALLTVFRHFDNAEVTRGFIGAIPKTAWIIDYPLLERIYYDLVAGFNVFGGVFHQVSTRLYMDYLRMESENLFLSFLPKDVRAPLRKSWYRGLRARLKLLVSGRDPGWERDTGIVFRTKEPKAELLVTLLERGDGLWPETDPLNRCAAPPCERSPSSPARRQVETQLQQVASVTGEFVRYLPEVSLLRVHDGEHDGSLVYTIIHDRAHKNVAFLFGEKSRLIPKDDILTIVPGYFGSYPNLFFETSVEATPDFVANLRAVDSDEALSAFVSRWGVRRTSPHFWPTTDWLQADFAAQEPLRAGLLDLNRYKDP